MARVLTGLDYLSESAKARQVIRGDIAYLCHGASVNGDLESGVSVMRRLFGERLKCLMSPQHGFFGDRQANMIESADFEHPYFRLPVYSLYSKTRAPTAQMLDGITTVVVDLQDVGTRVYTYMHTLTLLMEECGKRRIRVVVLDRPNPIGGVQIEGNVLDMEFSSFVGRQPLPMRHGLTIGEIAKMAARFFGSRCELRVVRLKNWKRSMYFDQTKLPWVLPSPNIPTVESALPYVGGVLLEGTNVSEGRGTTRPFELIGHPKIEPFSFTEEFSRTLSQARLAGFILRPASFKPTFDKHKDALCGGFQLHVIDRKTFRPWTAFQLLLRELYHKLGDQFAWRAPPYEYEEHKLPIDILNGTDALRQWVERRGTAEQLRAIEDHGLMDFKAMREDVRMY